VRVQHRRPVEMPPFGRPRAAQAHAVQIVVVLLPQPFDEVPAMKPVSPWMSMRIPACPNEMLAHRHLRCSLALANITRFSGSLACCLSRCTVGDDQPDHP